MKVLVLSFLLLVIFSLVSSFEFKKRAGSPDTFSLHQFPKPVQAAISKPQTVFEVHLDKDGNFERSFLVDSKTNFQFSIIPTITSTLTISLFDTNKNKVDLSQYRTKSFFPLGDSEHNSAEIDVYTFDNPKIGEYLLKVKLEGQEYISNPSSDNPEAFVFVTNDSPYEIMSYMYNYETVVGGDIGLVATIIDSRFDTTNTSSVKPLGGIITEAEMEVIIPSREKEIFVHMHDDGKDGDDSANDGFYTGTIKAEYTGMYQARATLSGVLPDGTKFERSLDHFFSVATDDISAKPEAIATIEDSTVVISIPIVEENSKGKVYKAYAEIYGTSAAGETVAVCWSGGLKEITLSPTKSSSPIINLEFDTKWLSLSQTSAPFTVKNFRIETRDAHIPIEMIKEIPVKVSETTKQQLDQLIQTQGVVTEITPEMLTGKRPEFLSKPIAPQATAMVASHGFCAGSNPFRNYASDFSCCNMFWFEDLKQSRSNDAFANVMLSQVSNLDAWTLVGHSQGGVVGVHIVEYYWSGLDISAPDPIYTIQSTGTPWMGCTGASWSGLIPGGCSSVDDLTPSGAQKWLSGISTSSRQKASFRYTTNGSGSQCNALVNLILYRPNDGTTEERYATLSGGNAYPNNPKTPWCHTTGMSHPPQTSDPSQNQLFCKNGCILS